ncbi:uncharacterized protein EI90DRAFT_3047215 [Cantharellus anzutake]|uniref:uncharacterized protein n=1 Tax=Cantharellus anzutake TaxID=1750568 RepID=UPI001906B37D|nr:uncharacterized protein EI90DRAFT_3047215 [Cantharellus anzutake]KAF8335817.1 hypothetical protein EI90DRAFT_3047215 [Cantharellus anzutake]
MWSRLKSLNPVRYNNHDNSRRQSEDSRPSFDGEGTSLAVGQPNESNASLSSMNSASSKRGTRNIFRRSRLPSEFGSEAHKTSQSGVENPAAEPGTRAQSRNHPLRDPFSDPSAEQLPEARALDTSEALPQHVKTPSSGSVRSILRDPRAPSTGQSVRFNQRDAFRIITPNASASSGDGEEEGSSRTLLQRLRDAGSSGDDDDEQPQPNTEKFPPLLERDPFAATNRPSFSQTPLPSVPSSQDSSTSFSSSSSKDLPSLPSDMDNLFDVSNDLNANPVFDSYGDIESRLMGMVPSAVNDSTPSPEGTRDPTFVDASQTPRRNVLEESTAKEGDSCDSANQQDGTSLFCTPTHSRMPSEAPTIRPSPTSLGSSASSKPSGSQPLSSSFSNMSSSSHASASSSSPKSPDAANATMYHTPRGDSFTDGATGTPISFTNYVRPSVPRKLVDGDDTGVPAFLIPSPSPHAVPVREASVNIDDSPLKRHTSGRDLSVVDNTAFLVPNNSVALPFATSELSSSTQQALSAHSKEHLISHLKERLSLLESISVQYEADLSARDTLVDHLSTRISRADEEIQAWHTEADRTTRKFERLRQKVNALTVQCEALNKEKAVLHAEKRRSSMFDMASSAALRELHQRVGNLEASKNALEEQLEAAECVHASDQERMKELETEKTELAGTLLESERECARWKQAAEAYEAESTSAADLLNSLHSTTPAKSRINKSTPGTPYSAFSRPISMFSLNGQAPENDEQVYVLKSEIIRREQEHADLRELHRAASFKATEERLQLAAEHEALAAEYELLQVEHEKLKAEFDAQHAGQDVREALERLEKDHSILKAELNAQWTLSENANEKISHLTVVCAAAEEESKKLRELHLQATEELRKAAVTEEGLKGQIEQINQQCDDLTYSRDDARDTLAQERQRHHRDLEAAATNAMSAAAEIESLRAVLDEEQAKVSHLEDQLKEMQETRSQASEQLQVLIERESSLVAEVESLRDKVQQIEWNRDKTLEELEYERNHFQDKFEELCRKINELDMGRDILGEENRGLKESIRSLEMKIEATTSDFVGKDRECVTLRSELEQSAAEAHKLRSEIQQYLTSSTINRAEIDALRKDLESTLATKVSTQASLQESQAKSRTLEQELQGVHRQLKEVKQASADLEVKMLRLNKEKAQLEEDNSGLYMGLEAKQEELELLKRKLGVRGTAGSASAQPSSRAVSDSVFKQPASRRSSVSSSVADREDSSRPANSSKQIRFATEASDKAPGLPRPISRPRVSMPTPTPAAITSRYPSLGHAKNPSSTSSTGSATGRRPIGAPALTGQTVRRASSNSDVESVASASAISGSETTRTTTIRRASNSDVSKRPSGVGVFTTIGTASAIQAMKRSSSVNSRPLNASSAAPSSTSVAKPVRRLQQRSSSSLGSTPEEAPTTADKENQPDIESTPKAQQPGAPSATTTRRRIAIPP